MFQEAEIDVSLKTYLTSLKNAFTIKSATLSKINTNADVYLYSYGNIIQLSACYLLPGSYKCTIKCNSKYYIPFASMTNAQLDAVYPFCAPHADLANETVILLTTPLGRIYTTAESIVPQSLYVMKNNDLWYLTCSGLSSNTINDTIDLNGTAAFPVSQYIAYNHYPVGNLATIL